MRRYSVTKMLKLCVISTVGFCLSFSSAMGTLIAPIAPAWAKEMQCDIEKYDPRLVKYGRCFFDLFPGDVGIVNTSNKWSTKHKCEMSANHGSETVIEIDDGIDGNHNYPVRLNDVIYGSVRTEVTPGNRTTYVKFINKGPSRAQCVAIPASKNWSDNWSNF